MNARSAVAEPGASTAAATAVPAVAQVRAVRARGRRRRVLVGASLVGLALVLTVVTLTMGSFKVALVDVVRILGGEQIPGATFIIMEQRLPRLLTALGVGAAFGTSGTIFQTLVRNPLASPDVIGITAGASAAAVLGITVGGLGAVAVAPIALVGALVTAVVIYVLARRGTISGYRFVLVGVGVAAVLNAVTAWALTRSEVTEASRALVWITGSLSRASWTDVPVLWAALVVLLPLAGLAALGLRALELGDDAAAGLGARVEPAKAGLLVVAVALAAMATAAAGPVAFVAFLSGPVARRLTGGGVSLGASALTGACLVLAADFVATSLLPTALPVGVVTGVLGAPVLLWLMARVNRAGEGG
ncbi:FecCD family ABC transporter permease [Sanguibacter sp. A247]|uniref:FecCD family ABC transporter permease n=1 Tax=unclassified Sanguibacter TaxID=2645534 RepID=UPI003FD806C2